MLQLLAKQRIWELTFKSIQDDIDKKSDIFYVQWLKVWNLYLSKKFLFEQLLI